MTWLSLSVSSPRGQGLATFRKAHVIGPTLRFFVVPRSSFLWELPARLALCSRSLRTGSLLNHVGEPSLNRTPGSASLSSSKSMSFLRVHPWEKHLVVLCLVWRVGELFVFPSFSSMWRAKPITGQTSALPLSNPGNNLFLIIGQDLLLNLKCPVKLTPRLVLAGWMEDSEWASLGWEPQGHGDSVPTETAWGLRSKSHRACPTLCYLIEFV